MTGRIRLDKGRGIYVHETNKKCIDELKRKKMCRMLARSRKRVDRRQVGVSSKDQIQHRRNRRVVVGAKGGQLSFIRKLWLTSGPWKRNVAMGSMC